MTAIAYTVIAETNSEATMRAYVDWLSSGHIRDVIESGAQSATLVRLDKSEDGMHRAEVRYVFGSRNAFEAYEAGPAVALREDGIRLFGPQSEHTVGFRRTLGGVVSVLP